MPDRRKQIQLLIGSRFDLLWFPHGHLRTSGGLAPSKRVPCPTCAHLERPGWLPVKRGGVVKRYDPCTACGGITGDKPKAGRGVIAVDPMDATRSTVGSTDTHATARPVRMVRCDSCGGEGAHGNGARCQHCDGSGRRPLHAFNLALDVRDDSGVGGIDAAIDRRDKAGSYHQLDVALAAISKHVNKPLRYAALTVNADQARRLLDELYLHRTRDLDELTLFEQALVELALAYIDWRMPDPIVVPRDVTLNERARQQSLKGGALNGLSLERRNAQIRRWDREGKPRAWIGQQTGLSDRQLREIINGRSERKKPQTVVARKRVIHDDDLDEKLYDHPPIDEEEQVA